MLTPKFRLIIIASTLALTGCTQGKFDAGKAIVVGAGIAQAITLDEKSVKKTATLAAKEYDGKHKVAGTNDAYSQRLFKMTNNMTGFNSTSRFTKPPTLMPSPWLTAPFESSPV
jgi:predicted tellurium resistance membrane protein TerC